MLRDGGDLSCFRRLRTRQSARERTRIRGHCDVSSCCQSGCTAQLVPESALRGIRELLRAQRRMLSAVLRRSLCCSKKSCVWRELAPPRSRERLRCRGDPSVSYPVLCSGSRFGTFPAPCGTASLCFGCAAPAGSRNLPQQVCKPRQRTPHKLLSGPAKKALLGTWEPGPLAWLRLV
jgi:hypothetical protein